jgi:hypothetical protein
MLTLAQNVGSGFRYNGLMGKLKQIASSIVSIFALSFATASLAKDTCSPTDPSSKVYGYVRVNQKLKITTILNTGNKLSDEKAIPYFVKFGVDGSMLPSAEFLSCNEITGATGAATRISFRAKDLKTQANRPLYQEATLFMSDLLGGYIQEIVIDNSSSSSRSPLSGLTYFVRGNDGKASTVSANQLSDLNKYDRVEMANPTQGSSQHK